jgi:cytochrome c-type biogenesis protein CcmH/NrfG
MTAQEPERQRSLAELERAVHRDPTSGFAWGQLAYAYRDAGHVELSATSFEQAVRYMPDAPGFWHGLGRARLSLGDVDGALAAATRSVQLAPFRPEARLLLAGVLRRRGATRQAIFHLEEAVRLAPAWPTPIADLGWARLSLGE